MESCCVVDGISDHEVVLVTSSITADLSPPTRRTVYLWSQANFSSTFNTCISHVPTKLTTAKHHQPWINGHIKCLTHKKQRAYNQARSINSAPDWVKCKDIKRQCQYECRKCFNQYVSTLIDPNSNVVTKKLWSYIKSKKLDHAGVSTLNTRVVLTVTHRKRQTYLQTISHLSLLKKTHLTSQT